VTAETTAENAMQQPPEAQRERADAIGELSTVIENAIADGKRCEVSLFRLSGQGREPVAKFNGDEFDVMTIGERFGPGRYLAQPRVEGTWQRSATFVVAASPLAKPAPQVPPTAQEGLSVSMLFQAMLAQQTAAQQQTNAIITALIGRPQEGFKPADFLAAMKSTSGVGELVAALRELQTLAPEGGGGGGGDGEGFGTILAMLAPALLQAQRNNGAPPMTPTTQPRTLSNRPRPTNRHAPRREPAPAAPPSDIETMAAIVKTYGKAKLSPAICGKAIADAARLQRKDAALRAFLTTPGLTVDAIVEALASVDKALALPRWREYVAAVAGFLFRWASLLAKRTEAPKANAAPTLRVVGNEDGNDEPAADDEDLDDDELDDDEGDELDDGDDLDDDDDDEDELDDDDEDELDDDDADDDDDEEDLDGEEAESKR
jgi:hypothetical protein